MDRVKPPKKGHFVKRAVRCVETTIGDDDHLDRLKPERLRANAETDDVWHRQSDPDHGRAGQQQ